ncbi:hypothetical protein CEE37_00515 [candidate division LCP-89 bacterium B3_LCP]|uniref:Uncharacterized protein n=1 Tax=candidate division LCP-89 bacterium B3_LCP TaxID=2012998 RepID=A0A532V4S8_UNCL8|nr:MAG: hypothetical protein CEE37_00515 [candidate division LCP-89 bacterium B3_LCP]
MLTSEPIQLLLKNRIPFHESNLDGIATLMKRNEVDLNRLRKLGFRISRTIGDQLVVCYKGGRFGLVV